MGWRPSPGCRWTSRKADHAARRPASPGGSADQLRSAADRPVRSSNARLRAIRRAANLRISRSAGRGVQAAGPASDQEQVLPTFGRAADCPARSSPRSLRSAVLAVCGTGLLLIGIPFGLLMGRDGLVTTGVHRQLAVPTPQLTRCADGKPVPDRSARPGECIRFTGSGFHSARADRGNRLPASGLAQLPARRRCRPVQLELRAGRQHAGRRGCAHLRRDESRRPRHHPGGSVLPVHGG